LRVSPNYETCDILAYHNIFMAFDFADMLEVSRVFELQGSLCYMVEIDNFWKIDSHT